MVSLMLGKLPQTRLCAVHVNADRLNTHGAEQGTGIPRGVLCVTGVGFTCWAEEGQPLGRRLCPDASL